MNVYMKRKPTQSNQERLVSDALSMSQTPGAVLQRDVRPPLPQIVTFPPRFGYPDIKHRQATIEGVLDVARQYADARDDMSGGPGGYQGASRNVQPAVGF
jgi:hypothetical protein